ncbi:MAG TPA: CvpA family protein [Verrucomicrobiae bacterium]
MIAAATQATHSMTQSWSLDKLPFGWFDVLLVAVLAFGLFRGRKNGMTKEILPMLQWVMTVIVCGLAYGLIGDLIINITAWEKLTSYILGYLLLAFLVYLLFLLIKKAFMARLTGSNFFGSAEYYLGMISGLIRYICLLIFALALLNAPYYTAAELKAQRDYNNRWYGGGLKDFSGNYFPTLQSVQQSVFKESLTGPFIKDYLGTILINSVPADADKPGPSAAPHNKPIIHIGN